jgi:hypothetical protein
MTIVYVISALCVSAALAFFSRESSPLAPGERPMHGTQGGPFDSLTGTPDLCCAHRIRLSPRPNRQSLAWSGSKSFGADCKNNQTISRQRCTATPTYSKHARELGKEKSRTNRTSLRDTRICFFLEQMAAGLVRQIKRLIPQRSRRWFYSARSLRSLIGSKSAHTNGL